VQTDVGGEDNELILFDDDGAHPLPKAPKLVLARQLIEHIAKLYHRPIPEETGAAKPKAAKK